MGDGGGALGYQPRDRESCAPMSGAPTAPSRSRCPLMSAPPAADAVSFADLDLDDRLLQAIASLGFEEPTPIQVEAIPVMLSGRDMVGGARTGSGKTAAFGLPLLHRVRDGGPVRALVLAPTRELALQVTDALQSYAAALRLELVCVYGGAPYEPQLRALRRGATVIVGTPGRLLDHLDRGSLDLSGIEVVVLDEADEMLRMGFLDDVERLLGATPAGRQVALFSATMPPPIRRVARAHLTDPVEVQVEQDALSVDHIQQRWVLVPKRHKLDALMRVLRVSPPGGTLVFARTRAACAELADALAREGFGADALHGDLSQSARERVLNRLRAESLDVLVATDVAARGLDVDHLGMVINVDLPDSTEVYVHRIGRVGRAGRAGMAVSFATPRERRQIRSMERTLGVDITQFDVPSDRAIVRAQRERLADELGQTLERDLDQVAQWLSELSEARSWSMDQVAAAAVARLADLRGVGLTDEPEPEVVGWSGTAQEEVRAEAGDPCNEVEVFIPIGRRDGLRPSDVVGAIANEAGIPGKAIGRITLFGRNSFVGLPRDAAEHLLRNHSTLEIRGQAVELSMARGTQEDRQRKPRRGERDGARPRREPLPRKGRFGKPKGIGGKGRKKTPRGRR
ncbi:MAG: DEAD/DEAH box helicase [Deltaproteobacteria bacterium]|nr:MAG: DEAD/DEAH box helicase [Deltaproteobacteria bacterium]